MTKQYEQLSKWRERTIAAINHIMGTKCVICGYDKSYYSLAYHHIDPTTKEFNISEVRSYSYAWDKIEAELRKCVVVCTNCHGEIHHGLIEAPTVSSFNEEKARELYKPCKQCGKLIYHAFQVFCNKTCSGKYIHTQIDIRQIQKAAKSIWNNVDVVELLLRHNGNFWQASKEIGISDNGVRKRFKKITGCNNWTEYLNKQKENTYGRNC